MKFRVAGTPAPQGSKRHVGGGRMVEMSKAVGPWREAVRAEAQRAVEQMLVDGLAAGSPREAVYEMVVDPATGLRPPVQVTIVFVLPRPAAHYGTGRNAGTVKASAPHFPAGRPDIDKLARAVLDGLVMGGVMADDAQVVSLSAAKVFARDGEAPGAIIDVEAMT